MSWTTRAPSEKDNWPSTELEWELVCATQSRYFNMGNGCIELRNQGSTIGDVDTQVDLYTWLHSHFFRWFVRAGRGQSSFSV